MYYRTTLIWEQNELMLIKIWMIIFTKTTVISEQISAES
jgi:hypothetical protein